MPPSQLRAPVMQQFVQALLPQGGTLPPLVLLGLSRALTTPAAQAEFFAAVGPAAPALLRQSTVGPLATAAPALLRQSTVGPLATAAAEPMPPMTTHVNPLFADAPAALRNVTLSCEGLQQRMRSLSARLRTARSPPPPHPAAPPGDAVRRGHRSRSSSPVRRPRSRGGTTAAPLELHPPQPPGNVLARPCPAEASHVKTAPVLAEDYDDVGRDGSAAAVDGMGPQEVPEDATASDQEMAKLLSGGPGGLLSSISQPDGVMVLAASPKVPTASSCLGTAVRVAAGVPPAEVPDGAVLGSGSGDTRAVDAPGTLRSVAGVGMAGLSGRRVTQPAHRPPAREAPAAAAAGTGTSSPPAPMRTAPLHSPAADSLAAAVSAAKPAPALDVKSDEVAPAPGESALGADGHGSRFAGVVVSATGVRPVTSRQAAKVDEVDILFGLSDPAGAGVCAMVEAGARAWRARAAHGGRCPQPPATAGLGSASPLAERRAPAEAVRHGALAQQGDGDAPRSHSGLAVGGGGTRGLPEEHAARSGAVEVALVQVDAAVLEASGVVVRPPEEVVTSGDGAVHSVDPLLTGQRAQACEEAEMHEARPLLPVAAHERGVASAAHTAPEVAAPSTADVVAGTGCSLEDTGSDSAGVHPDSGSHGDAAAVVDPTGAAGGTAADGWCAGSGCRWL